MSSVSIKRIGVLRGGMGENYASSLRTGGDVISHIQENLGDKYKTFDILIDKNGVWHLNGISIKPSDLIHKIDIAWNVSGPSFANVLSGLSIPHISTGAFASTLENSREMLAEHMKKIGVDMPRAIVIPLYQKDFDGPREKYAIKKAKEIHGKFPGPWIVKSFTPDKSMGVHLAKTFPQLVDSIEDGVKHGKSILVEEFISGKVAAVHSIPNFRNKDIYVFPLGNTFGKFTLDEKAKLENITRELHRHMGGEYYLKSDVILNSRGKVYIYSIDMMPNLKPNSHFSEVCGLIGVKPHNIVEHIIQQKL